MARWLFEFLDSENLCNVVSLLHRKYSGVTYFYFGSPNRAASEKRLVILADWIKKTLGIDAVFCALESDLSDIPAAAASLKSQIKKSSYKYDIDITGGPEPFIAAVGYFMAESGMAGGNVTVQSYDIVTGKRLLCWPFKRDCRRKPPADKVPCLNFSDCIRLHDGAMISGSDRYDFKNSKFRDEIRRLWDAVKTIPTEWNRFCSLPCERLAPGKAARYRRKLVKGESDRVVCERVAATLKHKHIMYKYSFETGTNGHTYMVYEMNISSVTDALYDKSGTALEVYSCLAASESGIFEDCRTGVLLDLDGEITKSQNDTRNEIDLVMMCGMVPVFASCKNTRPTKEYLYEIETMARHFGGEYAVPALISTIPAYSPVRERAREMGIILIDGVDDMSTREFREKLCAAFGREKQTDDGKDTKK